jgi:16S rRNA (cytidine1402-2'-O)-methyltransferase
VLLDHYGVRKPVVSYHDFSEKRRAPELLEKIKNGSKIALISDAGTPGIADPGFRLIKGAIDAGIRIESIPGPCAFLAALAISGLPTDRFVFEGFLPVKSGQKRTKLLSLKEEDRTVIFYESPHRILKTLELIREVLGDIHIVVARELTKKFEEIVRDKVSRALQHFSGKKILGEFVILFNLELRED